MIQNGNLIRLLLNNSIVAKLTTMAVTFESEMLDKTTKDTYAWKENQAGNKSFSLSCEGLIADPFDRNMIAVSENFLDPYWVLTDAVVSEDLFAAPDGFIKANKIEINELGGAFSASLGYDSKPATSYSLSFWIKDATLDVTFGDGDVTETETFTGTGAWQRLFVTFTSTSGGSEITLTAVNSGPASVEVLLFGAQVNEGSTPSTYEVTGQGYNQLFTAVENGTKFTALITDQTTGNTTYSGDVLLNSLSRTTNQGQLQTFSCEMTGTGEITTATI